MWRNAMIADVGWNLFDRGADIGSDVVTGNRFTRKSGLWFAARLTRWWLFDLPTAAYAFVWTHEYGHKSRASEAGLSTSVVVTGSPWTLGDAFTRVTGGHAERTTPALYGGGNEATNVVLRRVERRVFRAGAAHHTDLTAMFVANAMGIGYVLRDLSPSRVDDGFIFDEPDPGDPTGYVIAFATSRFGDPSLEQLQATANGVRRGTLLNFVDYGLVTMGLGLFHDYLWRGQRETRVRWLDVGPVSVIPGVRYELTPVGPERQIRSYVKVANRVAFTYVRWSDSSSSGRLVGAGVDYPFRTFERWHPAVALDVWKNPDRTYAGRFEMTGSWSRTQVDRWALVVALGGKGRGYLLGFPERRGLYASIGGGFKF